MAVPIGNLPAPRTRGPDGNGHGHEIYGPYEDSVGPTSSRSGATTPASEAEEREEAEERGRRERTEAEERVLSRTPGAGILKKLEKAKKCLRSYKKV